MSTSQTVETSKPPFGVWSGVGLVVANMVGAGVFLSTGFMAQDMAPGPILLAWVVGLVLAMAGARAYAEVARLLPRSGGEYRYLSELLHPFVGYLAGWASLLVGFSAPIAVDAIAAGAYAHKLWPSLHPLAVSCSLLVALTAGHAIGLKSSARLQNALVAVKLLLLVGFVAVGATAGSWAFPTWVPPSGASTAFPLGAFAGSLFYIAFAFSGWNAAIYAAEEFKNPARDVPRAMLIGCAAVGALYLVLNYVFVANLTPAELSGVFRYDSERVTLGHVVMERLQGPAAAQLFSGVMVLLFVSAMSAMMLVGPRVYSAMAQDGVLPRGLAARDGHPPVKAVLLQGWLALLLVFTHDLQEVLSNIGAVLTLFAALTAAGLFRARFSSSSKLPRPSPVALAAAALYVLAAGWMLYFGFSNRPSLLIWVAILLVVTSGAWWLPARWARLKDRPGQKLLLAFGVWLLVVVGLVVVPAPISPRAWSPPGSPAREGVFAPNSKLQGAQWLARELPAPESIAIDAEGNLVTGLADGRVVRMSPDGQNVTTVVDTHGRPLGLKYGPDGTLYICDASKGLLSFDASGTLTTLADAEGGVRFGFTDDLAVARDGTIYFTDASTRFGVDAFVLDVLEHQTTGRLLKYDPATRQVTRLPGEYAFSNGVALGPDDAYLVVTETGTYRVWRLWLTGERAGTREVFADGLPGFPDNVTWSPSRHVFWVALFGPRDPLVDALAGWPLVRKVASHFPTPPQPPMGRVLALDENGRPVELLEYEGRDGYFPVTSAIEHDGSLYLGSVVHAGLARLKLDH